MTGHSQPMNETVDGELLPCPFCGAPASMTSFERDIGGPVKVRITQIQCTADDGCDVCVDVQHINADVAVKAWNTRAALSRSDAPVAGEIEKTKAGTINWKMEVERLNRLLKDAQRIIAEYRARAREVLRADLDAAPSPALDPATVEACAKIVDAEVERILSKQTPTSDPMSMTDTVNLNLRMMACILPDLANSIRALAGKDGA